MRSAPAIPGPLFARPEPRAPTRSTRQPVVRRPWRPGHTRQFPTLTNYTLALGTAEGNEGNSYLAAKKWDDAITWFDRSNTTLEPLLRKADDPRVRTVLRNNHWGRADALVAQSKFGAAILAYDSAIAMAEERTRSELRLARAMALAKSGDYKAARAVAEAETAEKSAGKNRWFDASKVFVAAATAAKEVPETADELQACAVAALRRAFELKYFDDARSRAELRAPDFALLRDRGDFKQLLADVEQQHPPKVEMAPPPREKK